MSNINKEAEKATMINVLKDGNDNFLRKAEWYWIAHRINRICASLSSLLIYTTINAPVPLEQDNWLTRGLVQEEAQMDSVSGLLAILGVAPSARTQDIYAKLSDPEGSGLHFVRTQAITEGDGLLDTQGKKIVYPIKDENFKAADSLFQFTSGMEHNQLEWWLPDGQFIAKERPVRSTQAADLFSKRWGQMATAHEPALVNELQGLFAQINALEDDNEGFVAALQDQVRRRELDLLQIYLKSHPHAKVPADVQAELDRIPGGPAREAEIRRRLADIRTTENISVRTDAPRGGPAEPSRGEGTASSSKSKGKARQVD
ncbi:unnamed protein product [Peniophora sp. CBMAI 1063]|nr:unnamed protein product [Peniophora sp. CBMAI 1063]